MAQMYPPLLYYVSPQLQHVGALHKRRRQFGGTEGSDLIEICQQTEVKKKKKNSSIGAGRCQKLENRGDV